MEQQHKPFASTASHEDRSVVIKDVVALAMEAAHGIQKMNEEQVSQILSNLVRSKLLSADDSYRLKDRLNDFKQLERALDSRIEAALHRRGIITQRTYNDLKTRVQKLENKYA